jgi:putative transposase
MKDLPQRRSIRLRDWDYSSRGYYFVTICTQNRECLFGKSIDGKMILNDIGKMIQKHWLEIPSRFTNVILDEYQIMPNHLHGIIQIVGATLVVARTPNMRAGIKPKRAGIKPAPTLGDIIGTFKSLTTHEYINGVKNNGWKKFNRRLWQRNYYEHIIRNEKELDKTQEYIQINPIIWKRDRNNPDNFNKKLGVILYSQAGNPEFLIRG